MKITIITVGAKPKTEISALINDYTRRMPKGIQVHWSYLKHGKGDQISSIKQESESILKTIPKKNKIILLDETGEQFNSTQLSARLFSSAADTTIIVGGAYGVNTAIKTAADTIWSLGKLVYPHQIVRLILSEQIYRAHCIRTNHPYHHD